MKAKRFQVKKRETIRITSDIKINCFWVILLFFEHFKICINELILPLYTK